MGNKSTTFTEEQLDNYQDCTFFTRQEILCVYKRYRAIRPDLVPSEMTNGEASTVRLPRKDIERMEELRENPFKKRICEAFSGDEYDGNLTFDDFLDLMSVFSEHAPRDIKLFYAFKIYDFDNDGFIGVSDLNRVITALTRDELTPAEHLQIIQKVLDEADADGDGDGDGRISYLEFQQVVSRAPEFLSTFHIRL